MPLVGRHLVPDHDLRVWAEAEEADEVVGRSSRLGRMADRAVSDIIEFINRGPAWVGTSWGKDSTVVVRLAAEAAAESGMTIPVLWFRPRPVMMPGCLDVRDAALSTIEAEFGRVLEYEEIDCEIPLLPDGEWGIDEGYDPIWNAYHRDVCPRHILGLRSQENATRATRERFYGVASKNGCAPITRWRHEHVFGYLHRTGMPVHPAYAMTYHGAWDRGRLRVAALGGQPGRGHGRESWERRYFGASLDAARASVRA